MDKTKVFDVEEINDELIRKTLNEVIEVLKERSYNPINQIVGYLMSGDPGYISNHNEARTRLIKYSRADILKVLIKDFIK